MSLPFPNEVSRTGISSWGSWELLVIWPVRSLFLSWHHEHLLPSTSPREGCREQPLTRTTASFWREKHLIPNGRCFYLVFVSKFACLCLQCPIVWNKNYPSSSRACQNIQEHFESLPLLCSNSSLHCTVGPAHLIHVQLVWKPDTAKICYHGLCAITPAGKNGARFHCRNGRSARRCSAVTQRGAFWADFPGSY